MRHIKLLLVEDDEDDYVLTRDLLDEFMGESYQLDWIKNADDARKALTKDEHDLCLMDYQLGSQDGIQLLQDVCGTVFSGPIIMLTGLQDKSLDAQALKAGAVDYLVKANLTRDHLERAVRYALARKDTEREKEERLRAESASRAKSDFLARLSHELRTPLTAILGYSDLMYHKVRDIEDKSYLQIIHQNGKHLLGLLNDVLDLSKIEAGKLEMEKCYFDIEPFFTDIFLLMNVKAEDKNLDFNVNFHGENFPTIYADPVRLRQIVLNLIGNAIKFTDQGSVNVDISTQDKGTAISGNTGPFIKICVTDTGCGIDSKKLDEIFQPFTQAPRSNHHSELGTGLGLTISRELVQRMFGELTVQSHVGVGSCFCCRIWLENIVHFSKRKLQLCNDKFEIRPPMEDQYEGCVLVVDDLLDIRRLLGHIISNAGVKVIYAENGQDAVEIMEIAEEKQKKIDMVLMDIQMPIVNGRDAAKRMRSMGCTQPLIALTASSMKGDREKCLNAGFTDFLGKPVEVSQLYSALNRYLPKKIPENGKAGSEIQPSLLLIEDNVDACMLTAMIIRELGWKVETALTGAEAIEKFGNEKFSTVVFDVNLPDIHGFELAKYFKERNPDIMLISLSGEEIDSIKSEHLGIGYTLLKPVNATMLSTVLREL